MDSPALAPSSTAAAAPLRAARRRGVVAAVRAAVSAAALCGLASCGGGVSVGTTFGNGDVSVGVGAGYEFDFTRPSVSLVTAQTEVQAGGVLRLVAAASDESGIEGVTLYRQDRGGNVVVSGLFRRPYEWQVQVPADGRGAVSYFAQATDNAGNRANSNTVTVTVLPSASQPLPP